MYIYIYIYIHRYIYIYIYIYVYNTPQTTARFGRTYYNDPTDPQSADLHFATLIVALGTRFFFVMLSRPVTGS